MILNLAVSFDLERYSAPDKWLPRCVCVGIRSQKGVFRAGLPLFRCHCSCESLHGGPDMLPESSQSGRFIDMCVAPFNRGLWIFKRHQLLRLAIVLEPCLILVSAYVPCHSGGVAHICAYVSRKRISKVNIMNSACCGDYVFHNCVVQSHHANLSRTRGQNWRPLEENF